MPTYHMYSPVAWREGRRLRAWELHHLGWQQGPIAAALGVTHGAVSQGLTRAMAAGSPALLRRTAPGAPPRLTTAQRSHLVHALAQGARAGGCVGEGWSTTRPAAIMKELCGVS